MASIDIRTRVRYEATIYIGAKVRAVGTGFVTKDLEVNDGDLCRIDFEDLNEEALEDLIGTLAGFAKRHRDREADTRRAVKRINQVVRKARGGKA